LLLERQQAALDGADRGRRNVAVRSGERLGIADELHHGAEILE
jgi:hypothetical protein